MSRAREALDLVRNHVPPPLDRRAAPPLGWGLEGYRARLVERSSPGDLRFTWLGTAGLGVTDGTTRLLLDPFVSRPGLLRVFSGLGLTPDVERVGRWLEWTGFNRCDAVAVSHGHFDHAMDAPSFARLSGARLMGSQTVAWMGRGGGVDEDRIRVVRPREPLVLGDFRITFLESTHSRLFLGRVPHDGCITAPLVPPRPARAWRVGESFALHVAHPAGTFVHLASASTVESTFHEVQADAIFLAVAGRSGDTELIQATAGRLGCRVLVPLHFDDFFLPLEDPMRPLPGVGLDRFMGAAEGLGLKVLTLPVGEERGLQLRTG